MICPRQKDAVAIFEKARNELIALGYHVTAAENIEQDTAVIADKTSFLFTYTLTAKKRGHADTKKICKRLSNHESLESSSGSQSRNSKPDSSAG